jgi:hypothetical protein
VHKTPAAICILLVLLLTGYTPVGRQAELPDTTPSIRMASTDTVKVIDLEPVWAGHPVTFALLTAGDQQFAAYYDAQRQTTLAQRSLGSNTWKFKKLPNYTKWDSHNYLALAVDSANFLHLSGNMHCVPLIYFRSAKPLDIDSMEQVKSMVGTDEDRVTYPRFQKDPAGRMVFSYRSGSSGRGNTIYNVYDVEQKRWMRLLDKPLFDGEGKCNAYMVCVDAEPGKTEWYHVAWVWRDSPDAATNHDPSYMRSRDLRNWETIDGKPITLPVTRSTPGVVIDPVPAGGGILNGAVQPGFGLAGELVISYYKFDKAGNTQLYFARYENGAWKIYQGSNWDYRWEPKGGGSLASEIHIGRVAMVRDKMTITISHKKYGGGLWEIDPATMKLGGKLGADFMPSLLPREVGSVRSTFSGMGAKWANDSNPATKDLYRLRWETLGPNRDRPYDPPWPEPVMLQLIELVPKDGK